MLSRSKPSPLEIPFYRLQKIHLYIGTRREKFSWINKTLGLKSMNTPRRVNSTKRAYVDNFKFTPSFVRGRPLYFLFFITYSLLIQLKFSIKYFGFSKFYWWFIPIPSKTYDEHLIKLTRHGAFIYFTVLLIQLNFFLPINR